MRLNYKILWFEDDDGFFASLDFDEIRRHLDARGFDTSIERMVGGEEITDIIKVAQKSDLIIVDFGLEEGTFGDYLISQLRDGNINTEVIFYSARGVGELRKFVYEKELDGVFCRARDEITREVLPIIDNSIKKILDLENSRGLVMAELGDLDVIMNEIIIAVHNSSEEGQAFIRGKMRERLEAQWHSLQRDLERFDELEIGELVEYLDSSKRLNTMVSICKKLNLTSHREQLKGVDEEVIFPRNCLGHGCPEDTDDGYIFRHRGREYTYNDESSARLRNSFRNLKRSLESLREEIVGTENTND